MATDDTSDSEDLLKVRRKSKREQVTEEKDYTRWLKGERAQMDKKYAKEMDALKRYWTDPSLDPDECFLRDYILNRGYLDMNAYKIPTYKDIVQDGGSEDSSQSEEEGESEGLQDTLVSTDEEDVDMQEQFERVYNFRFEEPGGLEIASYPRNIPGSVRRVSDTRKEKRKAREERKESEKEKKREELRRLKNLKRQEIMRKLDRIKAITGNPNVGFKEEELEGDFDPQAYDKMMEEAFAQDYYQQDEEEKPVFSADEDIDDDEDWGEYNEEGWDEDLHCEHPDFNMDVDFDPTSTPAGGSTETYIVSFRNKKSNKLSKFAEAVSSQKPYHDPDEKTFEEYFDEYYKLDFEDIIGDMPCRFKYREVIPMNFGLTTEEVLQAEDKELNKWVSLKKATQYRSLEEEKEDAAKYRKKGRHRKKKSQILTSVYQ
jgi:protein KRI1